MAYLLDTSILIEAKDRYYGLEFCPAFWDWLAESAAAGTVYSIQKVADELDRRDDELRAWARGSGSAIFRPFAPNIADTQRRVSEWATGSSRYIPGAAAMFLNKADYFIVAQALGAGDTVVSAEVPSGARKKIKIPDACQAFNIPFKNTFEMLRAERARFVLPGPR